MPGSDQVNQRLTSFAQTEIVIGIEIVLAVAFPSGIGSQITGSVPMRLTFCLSQIKEIKYRDDKQNKNHRQPDSGFEVISIVITSHRHEHGIDLVGRQNE